MNNKVDKFFKDKLGGHTLQPSAQAWEKVESHLSKKNKMAVWLRVAAAVALFGLLLFAALNWEGYTSKQNDIVEQKSPQTPAPEPKVEAQVPAPQVAKQEAPKIESKPKTQVVEEEPVQIAEVVKEEEQTESPVAMNEPSPVTELTETAEKPVVIVYSLPTIRKKEAVEPVVAETKKTAIERVLEIAKDVKNSDSPLADLREKKDEIFALDFRKDKTKKQNY